MNKNKWPFLQTWRKGLISIYKISMFLKVPTTTDLGVATGDALPTCERRCSPAPAPRLRSPSASHEEQGSQGWAASLLLFIPLKQTCSTPALWTWRTVLTAVSRSCKDLCMTGSPVLFNYLTQGKNTPQISQTHLQACPVDRTAPRSGWKEGPKEHTWPVLVLFKFPLQSPGAFLICCLLYGTHM